MAEAERWESRYQAGDIPWNTGHPSSELQQVVREEGIAPCRAIELGCGTGSNAVWLAEQGFDVTAVDLSATALKHAGQLASDRHARVRFVAADVLDVPDLGGPYDFFFDRGCYHVV